MLLCEQAALEGSGALAYDATLEHRVLEVVQLNAQLQRARARGGD